MTRSRFDVYPPVNASPTGTHSAVFVPDRPARVRGNTKGRPAYVWLSDENGGCPLNYARMVSVESEMAPIMVGAFAIPDNQIEECLTQATTEPNGQPRRRIPQQNHNPTVFKNLVFTTWYAHGLRVDRHLESAHAARGRSRADRSAGRRAHLSGLQGRPDLLGGQRHRSARRALHRARAPTNCLAPARARTRAMRRARIAERWTSLMFRSRLAQPAFAAIVTLSLCLLVTLFVQAQQSPTGPARIRLDEETAFVCPMHPDYTLDIAGTCPRCGMALVRAAPFDVRDYGLELTTEPAVVQAGKPATLRFRISHPGTGERILKFETVHERQYHLFVISQDMSHFQHIHPEQQAGWHVGHRRDAAEGRLLQGAVGLSSAGGASQFIARPLVTAGYTGDLAGDTARLTAGYEFTTDGGRPHGEGQLRSRAVRRRALRSSQFSSDRHRDRPAGHRSADVPRRVRAHAHHERGHGRVRPLALARHRSRRRTTTKTCRSS